MSKEIKIKGGSVVLKDFCSRKLRKEINRVLYEKVEMNSGNEGTSLNGLNMDSVDKANDVALVGMVEKILIDGIEKPVNIQTFDEMDSNDVDTLISEINKVTSRTLPNG